jgi:hypothetical protein
MPSSLADPSSIARAHAGHTSVIDPARPPPPLVVENARPNSNVCITACGCHVAPERRIRVKPLVCMTTSNMFDHNYMRTTPCRDEVLVQTGCTVVYSLTFEVGTIMSTFLRAQPPTRH